MCSVDALNRTYAPCDACAFGGRAQKGVPAWRSALERAFHVRTRTAEYSAVVDSEKSAATTAMTAIPHSTRSDPSPKRSASFRHVSQRWQTAGIRNPPRTQKKKSLNLYLCIFYVHIYIYIYIHIIRTYTYTNTYIYMHMYMYIYVYLYLYVYMYVQMCV